MRSPFTSPLMLAGLFVGLASVLVGSEACTNAPGTEEGGDPRFDASTSSSSATGEGGCGTTAPDTGDAGPGWSDLYADYFGPAAVSGCAGSVGQCHGETTGLGAQASDFVCAGGVSGCYTGITSAAADLVGDSNNDPTTSTLYLTLRKACGGGTMPKAPASFTFSPADMARIADWIGAGAPNN